MTSYKLGLDFALKLDEKDSLKTYRNQFHIPEDDNGNPLIYMTGNSLGLQPKNTKDYVKTMICWFSYTGH